MAPPFPGFRGGFRSSRLFPAPSPFAPTDSPVQIPKSAIPYVWQHGDVAFQILPEILRRSFDPDRDGDGSAVLPPDLQEMTRRPIGPPPEPPREQPPYRPLGPVGGLLGLIAKFEQMRRSISGDDSNVSPAYPDQKPTELVRKPDDLEQGSSDESSSDIRTLERVDATGGQKRRTDSPPLVPDMPTSPALDDDPASAVSAARQSKRRRKGPDCDKQRAEAAKTCIKLMSRGDTLGGATTLEDCIRIQLDTECGGPEVKWGLTGAERARLNNERIQRKRRGADPDSAN
ncbi:hypothetical protein CI41S_56400 [Bradyrhizobium ivorense]|nr:hypothetical protein CI41S_56400 [Bradyrhizobium ivorense]